MVRSHEISVERVDVGKATRRPDGDHVVAEAALSIIAGARSVATVMRTPGDDLDLVRGLLHAEGIVAPRAALHQTGPDRIEVDVDPASFAARGMISTSACGVCGRAVIDDLATRAVAVTAGWAITPGLLTTLPGTLRQAQLVFDDTGGLHAAGLFARDGQLVQLREDVGRHNAVDKVIGWSLDHGIDGAEHLLLVSGRLGFELVQKAVMFGIPLIAAVSAPSSLALEIADHFGMTVVGFLRGERFNIYTHGQRIAS